MMGIHGGVFQSNGSIFRISAMKSLMIRLNYKIFQAFFMANPNCN